MFIHGRHNKIVNSGSITVIKTKSQLKSVLQKEKSLYLSSDPRMVVLKWATRNHDYLLWKYVRALRYVEFYANTKNTIMFYWWDRKKNILGSRLGISMWHNSADEGLRIWHYGSVIVNANARLGKNCQLHGENCIGNKGTTDKGVPVIGDNVDIGVGAKIIGDVHIANGVKIGANAVVTKSCDVENATLVGIPAKMI